MKKIIVILLISVLLISALCLLLASCSCINFKELGNLIKSVEKTKTYPDMTDEEVLALEDEEFHNAVYMKLFNKVEESGSIDVLNEYQLAYFVVWEFDMEIQNGGLCQYFCNSSGENAEYVEYGLKTLSFDKTAELFKKFVTENNIDLSIFDNEINYDDYDSYLKKYDFDKFDDEYMELYDSEQIYENMIKFAREHYEEMELS